MHNDRLNRLYEAAIEAATALLEKNGSFFPILFEMRPPGTITSVAVLDMRQTRPGADVVENYVELMRERAAAGMISASAIVVDLASAISGGSTPVAAISVRLRALEHALDITVPYRMERSGIIKRKRIVALDTPRSQAVEIDVFM
ncbi:hypothetical protein GRI38_10585 [Altererythrobacter aurantiacus]|uniref:Uncharacterized protein n=1 Tax=Parapontixanthobacter aurantiacus TaxID=1463599 RepID=A0A844ZD43_9SPHN|nr:hypothetical protein [Parapontixanthobacter aurantiacus]MXO86471.1 hypothetical protein [Parapontixanthobacter aurantiacus]